MQQEQTTLLAPILVTKSPVRVVYIRPVYAIKLNTLNETCHICQIHLEKRCNTCSINNVISCKVIIGQCHHAFHEHCMKEWLIKNNNCPVDSSYWKERSTFKDDTPKAKISVPVNNNSAPVLVNLNALINM